MMEVRMPDPNPGRCLNYRTGRGRCLDYEGHKDACTFSPAMNPYMSTTDNNQSYTPKQPEPWISPLNKRHGQEAGI